MQSSCNQIIGLEHTLGSGLDPTWIDPDPNSKFFKIQNRFQICFTKKMRLWVLT